MISRWPVAEIFSTNSFSLRISMLGGPTGFGEQLEILGPI